MFLRKPAAEWSTQLFRRRSVVESSRGLAVTAYTVTSGEVSKNPFRVSWRRRLFTGAARLERLHTALVEHEEWYATWKPHAPTDRQRFISDAQHLLVRAQMALADSDLNTGWSLLLEADRIVLQAATQEELDVAANLLREEMKEKALGWRRAAVQRLLGPVGSPGSLPEVLEVTRIRNQSFHNRYHKFDLLTDQLSLLSVFLLGILLIIFGAASLGVGPLGSHRGDVLWAAILGALGGSISAVRSTVVGASRRIPEQIADNPVTITRPVLAAAAGVAAWLIVDAGFVTVSANKAELAPFIAAFFAGFSESYFISLLPTGRSDQRSSGQGSNALPGGRGGDAVERDDH